MTIRLSVNGGDHDTEAALGTALLYVPASPKFGCGRGQPGACIVIVDGDAFAPKLPLHQEYRNGGERSGRAATSRSEHPKNWKVNPRFVAQTDLLSFPVASGCASPYWCCGRKSIFQFDDYSLHPPACSSSDT
jgi:hypothetical protein